jgi:hypothetical protein
LVPWSLIAYRLLLVLQQYDFVAAPWDRNDCGEGKYLTHCVGGFGILMLSRKAIQEAVLATPNNNGFTPMQLSTVLQRQLPTTEVAPVSAALSFSVESYWRGDDIPMAVFAAWKFLPAEQYQRLEALCPEALVVRTGTQT